MKFHATGAGQAVVQLDVNYGVDYEPHKDIPPKVSFSFYIFHIKREKLQKKFLFLRYFESGYSETGLALL